MASRLDVSGVHAYYGDRLAVEDVSMAIEARAVTAVLGPPGCGKTTLLRALNRMHELVRGARVEGKVLLDGADVYGPDVDPATVRRLVAMVFSRPNPFPTKSVHDNVAAGLRLQGRRRRADLDLIVERALIAVGLWPELKDRRQARAASLSLGQQQRLCIARAVVLDPEVLLMDEPGAALDPTATLELEELVIELAERYTVVLATQDVGHAGRVSERTAFVAADGAGEPGRLVEYDDTRKVFANPTDRRTESYLTGRPLRGRG